jgi:A/G-specific adenine glycosylase
MDYGAMLKKKGANPNQKSAHYSKQPPFAGSNRQVRGAIIRHLVDRGTIIEQDLVELLEIDPGRAGVILATLEKDGFLVMDGPVVRIR